MLHASKTTQDSFSQDFDRFGDSFTEPVDVERLKHIMQQVEPKVSYMYMYRGLIRNDAILLFHALRLKH